jgi:hypothetical protein
MKTLKELQEYLHNQEWWNTAYYIWYKNAIEWIYEDIKNSGATSVQTIEKYLQDLINK